MFLPLRAGITASFVRDPVSGEVGQPPIDRASNPDLKPEKSKQFSAGLVFEPSRNLNGSVDFWSIRKSDIISEIGEETIFSNPIYYNDTNIVKRLSDGFIDYINVRKENRGQLNTSGVDVSLSWRGDATAYGRFGASMSGTYITEYKFSTDPRSPLVDGLGKFRDDKAVQRWRHRLNLDWDMGPVGVTVANTYIVGLPRPERGRPGRTGLEQPRRRGLLAVGPERQLQVLARSARACRHPEPAGHSPAVHQPVPLLPGDLGSDLWRPARPFLLRQPELQLPLIAARRNKSQVLADLAFFIFSSSNSGAGVHAQLGGHALYQSLQLFQLAAQALLLGAQEGDLLIARQGGGSARQRSPAQLRRTADGPSAARVHRAPGPA